MNEAKGAKLSACGKYRWKLWRLWDKSLGYVLFVGLNPSTADAAKDDATVRRWRGYAKSWGYGGFYAVNLYAFRTTFPKELRTSLYPVGDQTDDWIADTARRCDLVVACWGVLGQPTRIDHVSRLLSKRFFEIYCFKTTNEGHPAHPLRLRADLQPTIWRQFA